MNNVYHTELLVPRIEDAMCDDGRALGVTFRPPLMRSYDRIQQRSSDGPATGRMTYSIEGPVYIELVTEARRQTFMDWLAGKSTPA